MNPEPNQAVSILTPEVMESMAKDRKVRIGATSRSHFLFFHVYLAHYVKYPTAPFHKDLFHLTERADIKTVAIMAFRGSGKSTILTLSYPLWAMLGEQQVKFTLILCQTRAQAKQAMANLRRELETNHLLKNDLGPFEEESDEWGSYSLVFRQLDARIAAASTETAIRGLRHNEHRPQLIIVDDAEDLNSVKTNEGRQKTYQWLTSEVIPAGDQDTRLIVLGNYLHDDSLLMRLEDDIRGGKISGEFRRYPLVTPEGVITWPGKYPDMAAIEVEHRKTGSEAAYNREYLLRFVADEFQIVHPDWIRTYTDLPLERLRRKVLIGVDLAISERDTACFTSIICVLVSGYHNLFEARILPNAVNRRLNFPTTLAVLKDLAEECQELHSQVEILIEDVGYQRSIIQQLQHQGYDCEGVKVSGDKRARLTAVSPFLEQDKVRFPKETTPELEELKRQLTGFGKERYDDLADAFSVVGTGIMDLDRPGPFIGWLGGGGSGVTRLYTDEFELGYGRWGVPITKEERIRHAMGQYY